MPPHRSGISEIVLAALTFWALALRYLDVLQSAALPDC